MFVRSFGLELQSKYTSQRTSMNPLQPTYALRHPDLVIVIRVMTAVWLLFLGSFLCAYGYWWGSFLFLFSALHIYLAVRLRAISLRDTQNESLKSKRV